MSGHDTAMVIVAALCLIATTARLDAQKPGGSVWHGIGMGIGLSFVVAMFMLGIGGFVSVISRVFGL